VLAVLSLLGTRQTVAQSRYEGRPIVGIRFAPQQQPLTARELAQKIQLNIDEPYRSLAIQQAITRLAASGHYENIEVDAEAAEGGVIVTFRTETSWYSGGVQLIGNPGPVSAAQLQNAARLTLGQPFFEAQVNQAVEGLQNELRLNGFYQSMVIPEVIRDPLTRQATLRFRVESGRQAHFGPPRFSGDALLKDSALVRASGWRRPFSYFRYGWRPLTESRVQQGVARMRTAYQKKERLMAKVSLERMEYQPERNVGRPQVRTEAGPRVKVDLVGAKISRTRLRELLPVYAEQSVDRDLLVEGERNLAAWLRAQGYFRASVKHRVEEFSDKDGNGTRIVYEAERGERYKLTSLEIKGNEAFRSEELRERMNVTPATRLRFPRGRFSDSMLAEDEAGIRGLYRANGYREATVKTRVLVEPDKRGGEQIHVYLDIVEGTRTLVGKLRLEGFNPEDEPFLRGEQGNGRLLQCVPGQPFSEPNVDTDRNTILSRYFENGFTRALFEWSVLPLPEAGRVELVYRIIPGEQTLVRDVIVSGLETTSRSLVRNRISVKPGALLSQNEVLASQRRLYDLGIFARVNIAQQNPEGEEEARTMIFNMEEARRTSVFGAVGAEIARIGGGITSFDSPAGGAGFSPRVSLGINRTNFLGLGHTVGLQTRLSNIQQRVLLSYLAPQFRDSDRVSLSITGLFDEAQNVRTFNSRRLEASAQLAQRLSPGSFFQYRYTLRRVTLDQSTLKIQPLLIPILTQPARTGIVSTTFLQDRRDDPLNARRGIYTTFDAGLSTRGFGSNNNFYRLLARNATYHRVLRSIPGEFVVARNTVIGLLRPYGTGGQSLGEEAEVPLPERFFSGGANSHRGFPENQAGPRDPVTGFPVGGNGLLTNNLELRFPVYGDSLGGVLFHDMGNVFSRFSRLTLRTKQRDLQDFDYMVHTFGFGIRYRTPVGPVRVDLGYTPNSARFNGFQGTREQLLFGGGVQNLQRVNRFQFHISLGQSF
jgi:outer membrane protein insertion porin family